MGFAVDVIHHRNQSFIPEKEYSLFLDSKWNMERIAPLLGADCKKIFYVVTAHPAFHNLAELRRLLALQQRKGVSLAPRRQERLNRGIEHADCAIVRGNEFTMNTYRYAKKPLHWIPLAPRNLFPWPETKDFEQCRNHFLWFGGAGMVHKGLDLVLECFAKMPECQLTVCGPVEAEQDFVAAYHRELYELPNVHLAGWMDVDRPEFLEIANRCVAVIHPSCSEAGGGAVITCVHAGLIPIVSYESSVNVNPDWGIVMNTSSVEEIQESVFRIAHLSPDALRGMARSAWEYERANHIMENYRKGFRRVIAQVADGKKQPGRPAAPNGRSSTKPASSDFAGGLHVA
jgi:glycosyltransferase involved in cell wall biosynthesis